MRLYWSKRHFARGRKESIMKLLDRKLKKEENLKTINKDSEINQKALNNLLKDYKEDIKNNEYIKLIQLMKEEKEKNSQPLPEDEKELSSTIEDLRVE